MRLARLQQPSYMTRKVISCQIINMSFQRVQRFYVTEYSQEKKASTLVIALHHPSFTDKVT